MRKRCLRCGASGIFTGYFDLADHCPKCDLPIEREDGYWVGALTVNIGVAIIVYGIFLIGGLVLFWPDPPYTVLLIGGISIMALLPILMYPWSKTLWWWLDVTFVHPPGENWEDWEHAARAPHSRET